MKNEVLPSSIADICFSLPIAQSQPMIHSLCTAALLWYDLIDLIWWWFWFCNMIQWYSHSFHELSLSLVSISMSNSVRSLNQIQWLLKVVQPAATASYSPCSNFKPTTICSQGLIALQAKDVKKAVEKFTANLEVRDLSLDELPISLQEAVRKIVQRSEEGKVEDEAAADA